MEVSDNVLKNILQFVKEEIGNLQYGDIVIEIQETANKIDVVTRSRKRFSIKEKKEEV
jgi:hypothetical protein